MLVRPLVTVILPTYNEARNIVCLVEWIGRELTAVTHEILVVDDNSPDGTARTIAAAQPRNPNLRVIVRTADHGLVPSIRDGLAAARGEICIWMDADLSMSPALLPRFIQEIESGSDLVVGSRYIPGGGMKGTEVGRERTGAWSIMANIYQSEDSLVSALISKYGNRMLRWLLHPSIHDYSSGFFGGRREFFQARPPDGDFVDYCVALPYKALVEGFTVTEVPMVLATRVHGVSKTSASFGSILKIAVRCFSRAVWLRLTFRPTGKLPCTIPGGN